MAAQYRADGTQILDGLALLHATQVTVGCNAIARIGLWLQHVKAGPLLAVAVGIHVKVKHGLIDAFIIRNEAPADK